MASIKVRVAHPRVLGGKLYHAGVHQVPEELKGDWFFKAQVDEGHVSILPEEKVESKAAPVKPQPQGK